MAIDYSKWDKIELSDDSDVEVHPNVDKRSFIRWKQQDIHQKRDQRNHDISNLEVQIPMYEELNRRADQLMKEVDDDNLGDYSYIQEYLQKHFDTKSKPEGVEPDAPTHNEMIEDLFIQLKGNLEKAKQDPNSGENLRKELLGHRKKIDEVLFNHKDKLKSLLKERELHISSDDIHTGWDRSFLNKGPSTPNPSVASSSSISNVEPSKPVPSQSEPSTSEPKPASTSEDTSVAVTPKSTTNIEKDTLAELHADTLEYSFLETTDITKIKSFLKAHTHIINPKQKDSLLMKAFDSQLEMNPKRTKQVIFFATLLQYIYDIVEFKRVGHPTEIGIIVDQLLGKMFNGMQNPALEAFESEVERTFQHIKQRCEIIFMEQSEENEGVEEIQLKSLDDNTELVVNLPDENSTDPGELERFKIFKTLPQEMQDALKTRQLDEVNNVFHGIPIEEAEEILEVFEQCEVIGVQAVVENEQDWKELKSGYQSQFEEKKTDPNDYQKQETPKIEELEIVEDKTTADVVD